MLAHDTAFRSTDEINGEPTGARTQDSLLKRQVLYQLSYRPTKKFIIPLRSRKLVELCRYVKQKIRFFLYFLVCGKRVLFNSIMMPLILDIIYPQTCVSCDAVLLNEEHSLCWDCSCSMTLLKKPYCSCCGLSVQGMVPSNFRCHTCKG